MTDEKKDWREEIADHDEAERKYWVDKVIELICNLGAKGVYDYVQLGIETETRRFASDSLVSTELRKIQEAQVLINKQLGIIRDAVYVIRKEEAMQDKGKRN